MKRTLVLGLLCGLILTLLSLIKSTGLTPPMVPCEGVGPGCVPGLVIQSPTTIEVVGHRGYPLAIIYLQKDDDGSSTYEGYSASGTIGDLLIYSVIAIAFIFLLKKLRIVH